MVSVGAAAKVLDKRLSHAALADSRVTYIRRPAEIPHVMPCVPIR